MLKAVQFLKKIGMGILEAPSSYPMHTPRQKSILRASQESQQILNDIGPKILRLHGTPQHTLSNPKVFKKQLWQMHCVGVWEGGFFLLCDF